MRVAIGGIYHESNSFASPTTLDIVQAGGVDTGDDILSRWRDTNSEIAGFIDGAEAYNWETTPTLAAWIMPSGPLTDDALDALAGELCERIVGAGPVDGVLLLVHGAMVSESRTDPDAYWLDRVRQTVGPDVPIVATADFHGNITPEMLEPVDALVGYDTYPHVDYRERGAEAASLLDRVMRGDISPVMRVARLPIIPHLLRQFTGDGVMKRLVAEAHRAERSTGTIWASVFGGFAWADVPHNGLSIVVGTDDDPASAEEVARAIAREAWARRGNLVDAPTMDTAEAVREAVAWKSSPVVLVDTGDNVGGGTPGDYPVLLNELVAQNASRALVVITDPDSVERAVSAGVRNEAAFEIGGKTDPSYGTPAPLTCRVRTISDGIYTNVGEMRDGITDDMGRTAVLQHDGVTIVVTERRVPMWNLQQLRSLGIEPTRLDIIVVKAAIAHRAAYSPIAARMIDVATPGITDLDVGRFEYSHLRRPVLPLDPDTTYTPPSR